MNKIALFFVFTVAVVHAQQTAHYRTETIQGKTLYLPDRNVTPGAVDTKLTKTVLCATVTDPKTGKVTKKFHTGTVRNIPQREKVAACKSYGITRGCPGKNFELDHLRSLELGGSNDIKNLWPQYADSPKVIGFHTKDVVENRAAAAVCSGNLTLAQAQAGISDNWYQFGLMQGFIRK